MKRYINFMTILLLLVVISPETGFSVDKYKGYKKMAIATFAGGCFWCMEPPFHNLEGVEEVISGYTGGDVSYPSYNQVTSGSTGHYEAVRVIYNPNIVTYEELLETFWRNIDPTDSYGQFADRGSQYKTAIFYHDDEQKRLAQESKKELADSRKFSKPIRTEILEADDFFDAEEYHQDYYLKNPDHYNRYKEGSGRAGFLKKNWSEVKKKEKEKRDFGDMENKKSLLSPIQFHVTQECGTEPPFNNEYWDNKEEGIYVDVVSGEVLFSSVDKYDSGTGWPSFSNSIKSENIVSKEDRSHGMVRTEVRSAGADSHLGHLFDDNHSPTGMRYCINSASLLFIPRDQLAEKGYGDFEKLFSK